MSEEHSAVEVVPAAVETPAPPPAVVESSPEPPATPEPAAPVAPAEPAATPVPEARVAEPGFLSTESQEEAKAAPPPEEPKPAEPAPGEQIEYKFELPEGMELDPLREASLTTWLGEHKIPPEKAQLLINMHFDAIRAASQHTVNEQWRAFNDLRIERRNEVFADPVLGGASVETSRNAAQRVMRMLMPDQGDRAELYRRLDASGMSDDLYLTRLLVGAARRFEEPVPFPSGGPLAPRAATGRPPRQRGGGIYTYPRGQRQGG